MKTYTALAKLALDIDTFENRIAKPSYKDYAEKKRKDGEKPLSEDAWKVKVLGEKPTEHKEEKADKKPEKAESGGLKGLFNSVKNMGKGIADSLKSAPAQVQKIFSHSDTRKEAVKDLHDTLKKGGGKIRTRVYHAAKEELHELGHAAKAVKKCFEKPPQKWDKKDWKALYAASVYAAGAAISLAGGGPLVAAGAVGKSFAAHVGIKAMHRVLDHGFLHFEAAETALHVLHHVAAEEEDPQAEMMMNQLTAAIQEVLADGVSDADMKSILSGTEEPDFDKLSQPKAAKVEEG